MMTIRQNEKLWKAHHRPPELSFLHSQEPRKAAIEANEQLPPR